MTAELLAGPLLVGLIAIAAGSGLASHLLPRSAARLTAVMLGSLAFAAVVTSWLLGLSGLAHLGLQNPLSDWSAHLLPGHSPAGALLGVASLGVAVIGTVRVARVVNLHRRLSCHRTPVLEIVQSDEIFAHTLPGPAGTVVVSTGLRRLLDEGELATVMAHERAHAQHRHDRLILVGLAAKAFLPPVNRLASQLEFHLERWADEEAVRSTGRPRDQVARTLAKVALNAAGPAGGLGVARHSVVARAEALLRPAPHPSIVLRLATGATAFATLALTVWLLRDVAVFVSGLHP